jgi:hypothetical protein
MSSEKSQNKVVKHSLLLSYAKGHVTACCVCGMVRRYESDDVARKAFEQHKAAKG